jgi:hypothetical protein
MSKCEKHSSESRKIVIAQLKRKLSHQKTNFTNVTEREREREASAHASCIVTCELAKAKKPLSDGVFVKTREIKMTEKCTKIKLLGTF